jgi:hypothetical protein
MDNRNSKGQFLKGTHWREHKPFWEKDWLNNQYSMLGRTAMEIAKEYNCTESNILFWLRKHGIKARDISTIRKKKKWGLCGSDNPMWNKRGNLNPNWKGGIASERQAFYVSRKWKDACSFVWKRDNATCQRCHLYRGNDLSIHLHIHHIKSFSEKKLRAKPSNLILLCEACHNYIHSRRNVNGEYLL